MKKKISFCLLCGVLLLGVTGCGNNDTSSLSNDNNDNSTTNKVNYEIGQAIYFNPESNISCKATDVEYNIDDLDKGREEETVKSGCMRWYIIDNSNDDTLNLILDHRTTYSVAYSNIESKLQEDTSTWDSSVSPRLITVEEIINATNLKLDFDGISSFRFEQVDDNNVLQDNFAWLYQGYYTSNNGKTTFGYWTSTPVNNDSSKYFVVTKDGEVESNPIDYDDYGIRPVITINKDLLK